MPHGDTASKALDTYQKLQDLREHLGPTVREHLQKSEALLKQADQPNLYSAHREALLDQSYREFQKASAAYTSDDVSAVISGVSSKAGEVVGKLMDQVNKLATNDTAHYPEKQHDLNKGGFEGSPTRLMATENSYPHGEKLPRSTIKKIRLRTRMCRKVRKTPRELRTRTSIRFCIPRQKTTKEPRTRTSIRFCILRQRTTTEPRTRTSIRFCIPRQKTTKEPRTRTSIRFCIPRQKTTTEPRTRTSIRFCIPGKRPLRS